MKKKLDKFDMIFIYLFLVIPIIIFTPLFGFLFKFVFRDFPWIFSGNLFNGLFPLIPSEAILNGATMSFLFFVTLSLFVLEVKKKYLISGIILGLVFFLWFVMRLDYIYLLWDFSGPLAAFIIAKIFLFIKVNYFKKG